MLQVEKIKVEPTQHLLHGVGVTIVESGVGCYAWPDLIEINVTRVVLNNLVNVVFAFGPRAYEGHVALHDVPQLWQLVEMVVAKESSHLRHAAVLFVAEELWTVFLGVDAHASELIDGERTAKPANALLLEDGRTAILALHQDIANKKQGREHNDACQGHQEIDDSLGDTLHLIHTIGYEPWIVHVIVPLDVWGYVSFLLLHVGFVGFVWTVKVSRLSISDYPNESSVF